MKELKAYFESRQDVAEVYVNESGEWLRHQTPTFNTLVKRDDLLREKETEPATENSNKKNSNKK